MQSVIKVFHHEGKDLLTLPATLNGMEKFKAWLSCIAEELVLPDKTRKHLLVVIDEIVANIVSYAYVASPNGQSGATGAHKTDDSSGHMTLQASFDSQEHMLTLIFTDTGTPFNPLNASEPDIFAPLEERTEGGLGIFFVKKFMDSVEYRYENGQNILTVKKKTQ